ncbi:MAG: aminopeptidase family protein, partial [Firmicutes bacterium]|nr:aminopeptidase family protein [Bacillota bacterium]
MTIQRGEYEARQERLRQALRDSGFAGALVVGRGFFDRPGSLAYLTGHFPPFISAPFADATGGAGLASAIFPALGEPVMVETYPTRPDRTAINDVRAVAAIVGETINVLREKGLGAGRLAVVDGDLLPWAFARVLQETLPDLRLVPFDGALARMRSIKSQPEVALIRNAALVADAGLKAARAVIRPGATEREVGAAGHNAALLAGADFVRYFRVHSGPWAFAGARWPQAMDRVMEEGDYIAADII